MFRFSKRSKKNLKGVHNDLVEWCHLTLKRTPIDFMVIEGLRSKRRQRQLYSTGKSKTMNSRHLTGHAVDIVPIVNGTVSWDWKDYYPIAEAGKKAAEDLGIDIEWGGDWKGFPDAPHWQLSWKEYPSW